MKKYNIKTIKDFINVAHELGATIRVYEKWLLGQERKQIAVAKMGSDEAQHVMVTTNNFSKAITVGKSLTHDYPEKLQCVFVFMPEDIRNISDNDLPFSEDKLMAHTEHRMWIAKTEKEINAKHIRTSEPLCLRPYLYDIGCEIYERTVNTARIPQRPISIPTTIKKAAHPAPEEVRCA